MNPAPDTLDAVLDDAWQQLTHAVDTAKHGFHLPTLCTTAPDHTPRGRIVVLRNADREHRAVMAHTDDRSPKVAELQQQPKAAWLFYDPGHRVQVRLTGRTQVLTRGELVDARWAASNPSSRRCYLAPHPPGTPCDKPSPNLPPEVRERVPHIAETLPGQKHFAVVQTVADSLDVLYLHHAGHCRASYRWVANQGWQGTWAEV